MIDGAINGLGKYTGKTYFFSANKYAGYDWTSKSVGSDYPQPLSAWNFPGAVGSGVDAALNGAAGYMGKGYFFKAGQYIRYDWKSDAADAGYPKPLSAWGLTGAFATGLDAALDGAKGYADYGYFFKGGQYMRYDWKADNLSAGYPQPLSAWKLPGDFANGIDAAVNGVGDFANVAYFFKGNQYVVYDWEQETVVDGPKDIDADWRGLREALSANPVSPNSSLFSFDLRSGESIGERIVRCCEAALGDQPIGEKQRHDFYRDFISCRQEATLANAEALTHIRTSCAMFVRAVRQWCGATPVGPYIAGTGMFVSMGGVSFNHPAFVPNDGQTTPNPGDYFYIASSRTSNDGHTGIFIEQIGSNEWKTAEGGGGDGTTCQFTIRKIVGNRFVNDQRQLHGWFDCTKVGLPDSP